MEEVTFVVIYSVRRYTCLPGNNRLRLVFYHQAANAESKEGAKHRFVEGKASGTVRREDKTKRRCVQI